jgi:alpha-glucosidase (family GH31 glycosyl hydrolase)
MFQENPMFNRFIACLDGGHVRFARRAMHMLTTLAALAVVFGPVARAQKAEEHHSGLGALDAVSVVGDTLTLRTGNDTVVVEPIEGNILRVDYKPMGKGSPQSLVIDPDHNWTKDAAVQIDTSADPMVVETSRMLVKISKSPVRFAIYDRANNLLIKEPKDGGVSVDGLRFAHAPNAGPFFGIKGISLPGKNIDATQDIRSGITRTGGTLRTGLQGDAAAPLIYTSSFGLLVDSDGGRFDTSEGNVTFKNCSRQDTEYFVIVGDPKAIMRGVADISGHAPMMPKWTLGFMHSQWGTTQADVLETVNTYRAKKIPLDAFILDFDWKAWGEDNYGEFRWNSSTNAGNLFPNKFPDGASGKFADELRNSGIKLVGILKPRILVQNPDGEMTEGAKYAADHHFFIDSEKPYKDYFSKRLAQDIDFSNADARSWYWQHMIASYKAGIQYFWNDEADAKGNFYFPNLQNANMERALYEGARSVTDQRVWSINRTFYLGAQRYSYALWSGDEPTGFRAMSSQPARMLASISLGEPHWSMDTGGFKGHPSDENYARWIQLSAFVPIMRVHGGLNEHRQPWVYGPVAEAAASAAINFRYRLMPYMYANEHGAHESGVGIVRPLFWEFPSDTAQLAEITDEWMFGDAFLVAPIITEGQEHRTIYLPPGEWIDYFRGRRYEGGTSIVYSVNPQTWSDIPLFVRNGAIVPTQEVQQYVGQRPVQSVSIDVFPVKEETSFNYYDDDGVSYAYEKGTFYQQRLTTSDNGRAVRFDSASPTGSYKPALGTYEVILHGISAKSLSIDGKEPKRYDDRRQLEESASEGWTTGTDQYGTVTYVNLGATGAKHVLAER